MSTNAPSASDARLSGDARIAVIAARFNAAIVDELLAGCAARLVELGGAAENIEVFRVPGAFELPLAAKLAAEARGALGSGRFDAVICLGCVIRGETPHFDYVAGEAARGIQQVALASGKPVIFGVLTTNSEEQARARAGGAHGHAGVRAADAAAEMLRLRRAVTGT